LLPGVTMDQYISAVATYSINGRNCSRKVFSHINHSLPGQIIIDRDSYSVLPDHGQILAAVDNKSTWRGPGRVREITEIKSIEDSIHYIKDQELF